MLEFISNFLFMCARASWIRSQLSPMKCLSFPRKWIVSDWVEPNQSIPNQTGNWSNFCSKYNVPSSTELILFCEYFCLVFRKIHSLRMAFQPACLSVCYWQHRQCRFNILPCKFHGNNKKKLVNASLFSIGSIQLFLWLNWTTVFVAWTTTKATTTTNDIAIEFGTVSVLHALPIWLKNQQFASSQIHAIFIWVYVPVFYVSCLPRYFARFNRFVQFAHDERLPFMP